MAQAAAVLSEDDLARIVKSGDSKQRPWKVRFATAIFLEGAPTLVQGDRNLLDVSTTAAKAAKAELLLVPRGLLVRYVATRGAGPGEQPRTEQMAVLIPYAQLTQAYMPGDWRG